MIEQGTCSYLSQTCRQHESTKCRSRPHSSTCPTSMTRFVEQPQKISIFPFSSNPGNSEILLHFRNRVSPSQCAGHETHYLFITQASTRPRHQNTHAHTPPPLSTDPFIHPYKWIHQPTHTMENLRPEPCRNKHPEHPATAVYSNACLV